jgi:hypothetical protein
MYGKFVPPIYYETVVTNDEDKQLILSSAKTSRVSDLRGRALRAPWTVVDDDQNNGIMLCVANDEPNVTQLMKCTMIDFLHKR